MKKLARCKHEGTEEEAVDNVAQGSSTSLGPVGHPYKGNSKNNLSLIGVEVDLIMNCKGGNRVQAVAAASTYRARSRVTKPAMDLEDVVQALAEGTVARR